MSRMITRKEAADILNVSAQTITNWVEKGVLKGHFPQEGKKKLLIDRNSIESYFDTFKDLSDIENCVARYKDLLLNESAELEEKVKEVRDARHLLGNGVPESFLLDLFSCVFYAAGENILTDRQKNILVMLLNGSSLSDIANFYSLTTTRILQIIRKSIRMLSTVKSWPKMHKEYKDLSVDNLNLKMLLEHQQERIKELEAKLNYNDEASAVADYSKKNLAVVLSRKLIDEDLSVRCLNCLRFAHINTVYELIKYKRDDLLKLRLFGKKCLSELENFLESIHLTLGMDIDRIVDAEVDYYIKELSKKEV